MPSWAADWTDANDVTYTALKSINGGGSGLIVTDFTPAGTEIVKFKYKPSTVSGNECVFCSRYYASNLPKAQFCGFRIGNKLRFDRFDYTGSSTRQSTCNTTTLSVGEEYSVVANFGGASAGTVTINDAKQTLSAAMATADYTPGSVLVLLASHSLAQNVTPTSSSTFGTKATGDLYYLQLWNADGETLEHDFKPAKRDSDGVIGLYDTVVRKFWPATVGSFTGEELSSIATATWTGAAGNGDFSDSGNWTCYDGDGNSIADAVPESSTDITLGADVPDAGWTAFNASYAGTIDLNGHRLVICGGSGLAFSVTDSSSGAPGELRFTIPEGETFEKTATLGISGNLSLVKDGPGTLLWSHAAASSLAATIPVLVTNGVFKSNAGTENLFGASGTITVKAPGQFDINTTQATGPVKNRTFYIEGDGPDGSGAIVNSTASTTAGRHLNKIVLTGDATIGGSGYIDIRDNGNGVDCGGHELTVKNTGRFLVFDGYLTNATDIVVSGGNLWVCDSCVLGAERIVLENGGAFHNYKASNIMTYNVPFVVREGDGTIRNALGYYYIYAPITVDSGCTLNFPTAGSRYICCITNEAYATISIGGDFWTYSNIFKNDGTVNHTAGKLSFGNPDANAIEACNVENNGTIRTSGGTFQFKSESSMTGSGTLELAGGSPQVLGDLSGFTGTIRVTGGTATISNVATFPGTLVLADGNVSTDLSGVTCDVVFDLSGKSEPFTIPDSWLTLPAGKEVTIDLRGRNLVAGDKLLDWTSEPSLEFSLDVETAQSGVRLISTPDGLYYGANATDAVYATWTGAANNGDFSDPGNWTCYDDGGDEIAVAVPGLSADITLGADVADGWTAFNASYAGTIDLNGHNLAVSCSGEPVFAVTNSSDAVCGELRITVPDGETFTKTASFGITGNLSLVKDGPGTFLWSHAAASSLAATIPVLVTNGVFKSNAGTENLFGASGTITVKAPGQFDINTTQATGPVKNRTFYIEGDGPDGSGAIVNSAASATVGWQLKQVVLTGDATIGGCGYIEIRDIGGGVDCGGYELTVKNTGRLLVDVGTHLTNATDIVVNGGTLVVCNSAVLGAGRVVLENGGEFKNYMDDGTKTYNVPFVVREGAGTITSGKNWYNIQNTVTVESGCTLNLPKDGPWYDGAITNETGATLNVSGEFNALGGIFKNDGLLNHTAGKFVFGHRDNADYPCAVENNGTVRTSGGDFMLKAESCMTGAGTLELAGGSPQVLGDLSGFTGTVIVSNGVAVTLAGISCGGTVAVQGGSTLIVNAASTTSVSDLLLEADSTLNIANYDGTTPIAVTTSTTLPESGTVNLTLNGGAFAKGVYAIYSKSGVTAADGEKFSPSTGGLSTNWSVVDGTLILAVGEISGNFWTGRSGDGRMSTAANWLNGVPTAGADIDFSGVSSDITINADANRTFGAVTMGTGVITFTNAIAATSFTDTAKIAVAADSTVTLDGDLVFANSTTVKYIVYTVAEGGVFRVTGRIVLTGFTGGGYLGGSVANTCPGTIAAKGLFNDCGKSGGYPRFVLARAVDNYHGTWAIGSDGLVGSGGFQTSSSSGASATIVAEADFVDSADICNSGSLVIDAAGHEVALGTNTLAGTGGIYGGGRTTIIGGRVVANYDVDNLTTYAPSLNNPFTVNSGATLALVTGADLGTGAVTVQDGGTLEVAESGTVTLNGNLSLANGAALGFNFTDRRDAPVLALASGKSVVFAEGESTNITVNVSGIVWPMSGEKVLTTCGGFAVDGVAVALAAGAPDWATGVSVNGDSDIVLGVKPMGMMILIQ